LGVFQTEAGEIGDLAQAFNAMASRIEEREERLTELDRLKSDFVSSVSHEVKTPLTTIKILAHLLQRIPLSNEDRLDYAKTIATECDRQIDFVGNLLDLSRIESGAYKLNKERVEVGQLVRSSVEVERHRAVSLGLALSTELTTDLPPVKCDLEALRRVVRGLIDNAIKYTPEGGRVIVSAHLVGQKVAIEVEDSGRGIPSVDLPHLFEKFYRGGSSATVTGDDPIPSSGTAAAGVGLGLYLARHIIEQFGGRITVTTELGVGTTFTVLLPVFVGASDSEITTEINDNVEAIVSGR
jgi:signal transduction histidine kinase